MRFRKGRKHGPFGVSPAQSENDPAPYYIDQDDGTRIEIVAAARAAGGENLPETAARELDDVEAAIVQEHERQHRDALESARGELRDLTDAFDRLEHVLPAPRDLEALTENASTAIERERASTPGLVALHKEQSRRQRDLNHLKDEHGLVKAAIYPVSRLHHLAMLVPVLLLEAFANAGFFSIGNDHGWFGGFGLAIFVSFLNVVLGCAAGFFCFRWRRHSDARLKRIASVGIVAYSLFAIVFNIAVARYRDLAATAGASQVIGLHELLSPSQGMSLASAALLLIGLLASGFSCWKGFRADDPTPGHGDCDRRFKRADEALRDACEQHHRQLLGHVEAIREGSREAVRRFAEALQQMGELVASAERSAGGYDVKRESAWRWCRLWLKKYRGVNVRMRTTPPPTYFDIYPEFPHTLDTTAVTLLQQRLEKNVRRLEEFKAAAHQVELGQPERMRGARQAFDHQWTDVIRRADARHGNDVGDVSPMAGITAESNHA